MNNQKITENYIMPAEWELQKGTWLSWPQNIETFGEFLPNVEKIYLQFIKILTKSQMVFLLVSSSKMENDLQMRFTNYGIDLKRIKFYPFQPVDVWIRDYGPTFVKLVNILEEHQPVQLAMINWIFNAWGDKYDDLKLDSQIPLKISQDLDIPIISPEFVLEGGSIEVNGNGIVLTTEQCLLNPNRNPMLSKKDIEEILRKYLGVKEIWWLKEGIIGDDTDGHIDDIARFISPKKIVCCVEENEEDENFSILKENYEILKNMVNTHPDYSLVTIPMPDPVIIDGIRLPASYANFYISNQHVIVPIFGKKQDQVALKILQEQFPKRIVTGIDCTFLVYGLGTLHCVSQQHPMI